MSGRRVRRVARVVVRGVVKAIVCLARQEVRGARLLKKAQSQVRLKRVRFRVWDMLTAVRRKGARPEARAAPALKKDVNLVRGRVRPDVATRVAKAARSTVSASRPARCVPRAYPMKTFFPMSPRRHSMRTMARRAAYARRCCAVALASPMPHPSAC